MTVRLVSGNLLASKRQTLVNTVNCVGIMGKGIALKFKQRYPEMYQDYVRRCDAGVVKPGTPYTYELPDGRLICNFPTKNHWRSSSRLEWVESGLDELVTQAPSWGITSLAIPPLGCGHGGLAWEDVGPLMHHYLGRLSIDVDIYVPAGVTPDPPPEEQLALL